MKAPNCSQTQPWPLVVSVPRAEKRRQPRAIARRRPDVSGFFAFTLVSALTSGSMVGADVLRAHLPLDQSLAFALHHPLFYALIFCMALLAGLLSIGEV